MWLYSAGGKGIEGGTLTGGTLTVSYSAVRPEIVTGADVIGGQDSDTGKRSGFELISRCYPKYRVLPDILISPKFSCDPEVAAVMEAKTTFSGVFKATALCDLDTGKAAKYSDAPALKEESGLASFDQIPCWPMVSYKGRRYHLSTHLAAVISGVDTENGGCPSRSPSNNALLADGAVLKDGTEVILDLQEANYLGAHGIVTALNFVNGWTVWGNNTACYPESDRAFEYFIPVSRMKKWIGNSLVLSYWNKVDSPLNKRLCESIADSANIWLNGLTNAGHLLGARVEILSEENPAEDFEAGILRPHVYYAPPGPAQEIDWIMEYDATYIAAALG